MTNKELQQKFNELTDRLNALKLEDARLETQLEALEKEQGDTEKKLMTAANVENILDAAKKKDQLEAKIKELIAEAETLLANDDE
jgi:UDP-N-acetyl-D-mannosaminuronic acid transferase (WecB/TagA/CpsF family)